MNLIKMKHLVYICGTQSLVLWHFTCTLGVLHNLYFLSQYIKTRRFNFGKCFPRTHNSLSNLVLHEAQ